MFLLFVKIDFILQVLELKSGHVDDLATAAASFEERPRDFVWALPAEDSRRRSAYTGTLFGCRCQTRERDASGARHLRRSSSVFAPA